MAMLWSLTSLFQPLLDRASLLLNDSSVSGITIKDSLNTLLASVTSGKTPDILRANAAAIRLIASTDIDTGKDAGSFDSGNCWEYDATIVRSGVVDDLTENSIYLIPSTGTVGAWIYKDTLIMKTLPQTLANKSFLNADLLAELTATAWQVTKYETTLGTTTGVNFTSVCDNASLPVATNRLGGFTIKGNTTVGGSPVSTSVASIEVVASGTWTSGANCATDLIFKTAATIAGGNLERVRITSVGRVGIGTGGNTPQSILHSIGANSLEIADHYPNGASMFGEIVQSHYTAGALPISIFKSVIGGGGFTFSFGGGGTNYATTSLNFYTAVAINTVTGTLRWSITSAGVLQSNGAQTISTSSGDLTLAANSDNTIIAGNLSSSLTIYTPSLTQAEVLYFKSGVTLQGSIYMQGTSSGATTTRNKLNYNCAINDVGGHIFSQVISNVTCYPFIIGSNGNLLINNTSTVADSGSYSLSFNGTAARTIGMESATGTNIVGNNLTINASASTGTGKGGDLVFQTSKGSATTGTTSNTVADSFRVLSRTAIVDVALTTVVTNASKGMLMLASGDGESYAWINFTSAGVVTLIQGSGDISVTDTGTGTSKICIYPNGTQVQVINRYAANKNITVTVIYNQ